MAKKWQAIVLVMSMWLLSMAGEVLAIESKLDDNKPIVIGFDDTFAPFGFKNEKGEIVGFDIDLATEIFKRMNVEYTFQPIDWSTKETELNTGKIDLIWNGYTMTDEREKIVLFSEAYMDNRQIILVKADSDIQTKSDLLDKFVATQAESSSLTAVLKDKDFVQQIFGGEPITYSSFVEVFADLDNGRADAVVVDERLATYYLAQKGTATDYRVLAEDFGTEQYAVGFRKDDQVFVTKFNETLAEIKKDGTFAEIEANWFADLQD